MNLFFITKELIEKFHKNKRGIYRHWVGYVFVLFLPVFASGLSIYTIGAKPVFESSFSQIYISIISIFAAFYISLLVYINQKVNEIVNIEDQTKTNNSIRTVNNSRKLTVYLLYSLISIVISITIILISNLKFSTPSIAINKYVTDIGGFIVYFTLYSFIILLFKILRNSQTDFIKDITDKESEINKSKL